MIKVGFLLENFHSNPVCIWWLSLRLTLRLILRLELTTLIGSLSSIFYFYYTFSHVQQNAWFHPCSRTWKGSLLQNLLWTEIRTQRSWIWSGWRSFEHGQWGQRGQYWICYVSYKRSKKDQRVCERKSHNFYYIKSVYSRVN